MTYFAHTQIRLCIKIDLRLGFRRAASLEVSVTTINSQELGNAGPPSGGSL